MVARAAAAIGAAPETVLRATVPWQGRAVEPLPEARRAEFADHLREIVAEAFSRPVPQDDPGRNEAERDVPPLVATACAACRGQCCSRGGTTAFLQATDIARWRQRDPEATAEEVLDWYLGMLPAESIGDACVFQGAQGCALPRDRRGDPCNAYHCRSLRILRELIVGESDPKVVLVVDDAAEDEARGVVGWSAATGPVGFVAIRAAPEGQPASER